MFRQKKSSARSGEGYSRDYAIVTKDYKLIHYYYVEDQWELIDRKKDPLELKNVYYDPAYARIKKELHTQLDDLRKKYHDNDELSQGYVDKFMEDAANGKYPAGIVAADG